MPPHERVLARRVETDDGRPTPRFLVMDPDAVDVDIVPRRHRAGGHRRWRRRGGGRRLIDARHDAESQSHNLYITPGGDSVAGQSKFTEPRGKPLEPINLASQKTLPLLIRTSN